MPRLAPVMSAVLFASFMGSLWISDLVVRCICSLWRPYSLRDGYRIRPECPDRHCNTQDAVETFGCRYPTLAIALRRFVSLPGLGHVDWFGIERTQLRTRPSALNTGSSVATFRPCSTVDPGGPPIRYNNRGEDDRGIASRTRCIWHQPLGKLFPRL